MEWISSLFSVIDNFLKRLGAPRDIMVACLFILLISLVFFNGIMIWLYPTNLYHDLNQQAFFFSLMILIITMLWSFIKPTVDAFVLKNNFKKLSYDSRLELITSFESNSKIRLVDNNNSVYKELELKKFVIVLNKPANVRGSSINTDYRITDQAWNLLQKLLKKYTKDELLK